MFGGATAAPAAEQAPGPAEDGNKLIDLSGMLDKPLCYARNENSSYPWANLFIGDSRLGMQSDADEQLIIHLAFQEFVRVCAHYVLIFVYILCSSFCCILFSVYFQQYTICTLLGKEHQIYGME